MATLSIIIYKPKKPLDPTSTSETGKEYTLNVGAAGNKFTTDTNKEVTITVKNVAFHKKVYSPCELTFQLNVTEIRDKNQKPPVIETLKFSHCAQLADFLTNKNVKLKCDTPDAKDSYPCLNYYIYKVNPQFATKSGTSSILLNITAYSVDHRLTLHKTNRAFTAKKFLSEVVKVDLSEKGLLETFGVPVNHDPKCLQFLTSYRKEVTHKQDNTETTSYTAKAEVIQPYMVQYDETYYNFVARTANRCGEFVYYEDGQLCLGLDEPFYDHANIINYDDEQPAAGRTKTRSSTITGISLTRLAQPNQPTLEPYYPKTMDNTKAELVYAGSNFVEDAKVGNDEFLNTMKKGKWVNYFNDFFKPNILETAAPTIFTKFLSAKTITAGLAALATEEGIQSLLCLFKTNSVNDKYDKQFWDEYGKDERVITKDKESYMFTSNSDQWDQNLNGSVFKDIKDFKNELNLAFYHTLLEYERKIAQEAITVETGADYDEKVKLGKIVQINGQFYIVVGVDGEYDIAGAHPDEKYSFTAIPVKKITGLDLMVEYDLITLQDGSPTPKNDKKKKKVDTVIVAIPPLYEHGHVCHSSMQRAIVTGVLDPQAYGRVQIKYPWQTKDNKDAPSPFIRVAKDFAGKGFGINFKPEPDTEVLVDYEGGNVERPFVVGMLHSFVEKPQRNTRSIRSYNGHKLVFNDPEDKCGFFWNLAGDGLSALFKKVIPDDLITNKNLKELAGGIELSDTYGFYKIAMSTDKREINISSPVGKIDINAFTGITINAPSGDIKICGKNVEIAATNNLNIVAGSQIDRSLSSEGLGGGGKALNFLKGVLTTASQKLLPDITVLRCIVEAFVKPCNGTLRIKSYRYLMLEAGTNGLAQIPSSAYKPGKAPKPKSFRDKIITFENTSNAAWNQLIDKIDGKNLNYEKARTLIAAYDEVAAAKYKLDIIIDQNRNGLRGFNQEGLKNKKSILDEFAGNGGSIDNYLTAANFNEKNVIRKAYKRLKTMRNKFEKLIKKDEANPEINGKRMWAIISEGKPGMNTFDDRIERVTKVIDKIFNKAAKLQFCKDFIEGVNETLGAEPRIIPNNASTAEEFIQKLELVDDNSVKNFFTAALDAVADGNTLVDWIRDIKYDSPFSNPWAASSHANGQILFSDSNTAAGRTIPLKRILDGHASFVDDPFASINTLPRLKHKMLSLISKYNF